MLKEAHPKPAVSRMNGATAGKSSSSTGSERPLNCLGLSGPRPRCELFVEKDIAVYQQEIEAASAERASLMAEHRLFGSGSRSNVHP